MGAPRWLITLLNRITPVEDRDEVIGDVEELHRRRAQSMGPGRAAWATSVDGVAMLLRTVGQRVFHVLTTRDGRLSSVELRLAFRLVRKQPILTLTAVAALGIGIGIAAGGASVFQQVMFSELPFPDGDRWVVIESYRTDDARRTRLDLERLRLFRAEGPFDYIAGSAAREFNVVHDDGQIERVAGAEVTPGTFAHLPYAPLLGRLLTREDGRAGSPAVALIRNSLWQRRFSGSPDVVGQTIDLAGTQHVVVGVLPDDAGYPASGEIWVPLSEETMGAQSDRDAVAGSRQTAILAAGVGIERAETILNELSRSVSVPGRGAEAQRHQLTPVTRTMVSAQSQIAATVVILGLVAVLIVIASNAGNLIVARTARRAPELAVRSALGASRRRLVGQLFAEVSVIVALAAVLGLAIAGGLLAIYDRVLTELPFWLQLGLDPWVVVIVIALAAIAALVMGALPAFKATRRDAGDALRSAGRGSALRVGRVGSAMIAVEVALSVGLLGAAVLFAEGFRSYVDPAFHIPDERVLTARIDIQVDSADLQLGGAASVADSITAIVEGIEEALGRIAGVEAVGIGSHLPRASAWPLLFEVEGRPEQAVAPMVTQRPGLLEALEVDVVHGRSISLDDLAQDAPAVAVVNEAFAIERFGTTQVVGRRLRLVPEGDEEAPPWREVVGVVPNVMEVSASVSGAGVYLPMTARSRFSVALRVGSDPASYTGRLRRAVFDVDPDVNVSEVVRLDEVGAENRTALAAMSSALIGIGLVTLLLSLAGVYAIVSLAVSQRTREIGVRVALGASRGAVLRTIVGHSALLVFAGGVVGALLGVQISRWRLFVFPVPNPEVWLFPSLVGLMVLAGVAACWFPARRALAIHPVQALKSEG